MSVKQLTDVIRIPACYVQDITDVGTLVTVDETGEVIESDDLRLAIELPGHHMFILQPQQHISWDDDVLVIQEYREVPEA